MLGEIRDRVAWGIESRDSLFGQMVYIMIEEGELPDTIGGPADLEEEVEDELRAAIDAAFTKKAAEMADWPAVTDCERLQAAFARLRQGRIVALESCGFDLTDGVHRCAREAVARDEMGPPTWDGYCFFHDQDAQRAVREGGGLMLAFGSFRDKEEDNAEHALDVARAVVEACSREGLEVSWSGSDDTRIDLPKFRWQRRLRFTSDAEVREFLDSWKLEIRAGNGDPDELEETMELRAGDWFEGCADLGPKLRERLLANTEQFIAAEFEREQGWREATMNDRIAGAFAELESQHAILALDCAGLTIQDGWGYAGLSAEEQRGVVFAHHEDVIDAVDGLGLLLAFGAIGVAPEADEAASLEVARTAVAVLQAHGVPLSWGGTTGERIRIAPFEWRKRRWTEAPSYARQAPGAAAAPVTRHPDDEAALAWPAPHPDELRRQAILVHGLRDENGFDRRRAQALRAAWKALGQRSQGQAGHLGNPHVFVRAGEPTTMVPRLAIANLRGADKDQIFLHAKQNRDHADDE
jgi:hypothetical protein